MNNADQIAEIRPSLREVIAGAPKTCVTFEVDSSPSKWLQVVNRTVNAAYPHSDPPMNKVENLSPRLLPTRIDSWKPGEWVTIEFPEFDATAMAHWIDAYFVQILDCPFGEYHLNDEFITL